MKMKITSNASDAEFNTYRKLLMTFSVFVFLLYENRFSKRTRDLSYLGRIKKSWWAFYGRSASARADQLLLPLLIWSGVSLIHCNVLWVCVVEWFFFICGVIVMCEELMVSGFVMNIASKARFFVGVMDWDW